MGLWSIITGAGKTGDVIDTGLGVVKSAVKGIDALVYTDEEKAVATAEEVTKNMGHVVALAQLAQNESGASAVTRRLAMFIVLGNFTIFAQAALVCVFLDKITMVNNLIALAKELGVATLAITVVVSIFGYYSFTKGRK